jgi:diacylglycerol kinase family enzyme
MCGTMRVIVIMNGSAGAIGNGQESTDIKTSRISEALERAGVEAVVRATQPELLEQAARDAARERPDAIVAAGGDGTISAVVSGMLGSDVPLGLLPTGTLNHFAKDAGVPLDLEQAAQIIATGVARTVDVGEVNGRIFINNSSIGLYPSIVHKRDQLRERLGRSKFSAMLAATLTILRRYPMLNVELNTPRASLVRRTPMVFVGNNPYDMSLLNLGKRTSLDAGKLSLYFTHRTGRFALLLIALRGLLGRLDQAKDFESALLDECVIETKRHRLRVANDGEVTVMTPPLRYRIRPGELKLIVALQDPGQRA